MIFEEKKIGSERIYEGAILNVRRDKVTAVKGYAYREIIEHNGAVAVVPIKDNGNIVMVEQYRYACGMKVLELPAGKVDKSRKDKYECRLFGRSYSHVCYDRLKCRGAGS